MTARQDIQAAVLAARDALTGSSSRVPLSVAAMASAANDASDRVGRPGNNDQADLIQVAAFTMVLAEIAAINGGSIPQ